MAAFTFVFSLLLLLYNLVAGESCKNHLSEYGFALVDHMYQSFTAHGLASCYIACNIEPACQSLNYNLADKTCEFNNDTKYYRAKHFVEKATSVYADNPDSERPWRRLNSAPVCFGARDDKFGHFEVDVGGSVEAVKLVHLHGLVACNDRSNSRSNWGCGGRNLLLTFITNSADVILLPEKSNEKNYRIPGYNSNSTEIVFLNLSSPLRLSSGQELRLWHGQDLRNASEKNNDGTSCADVFAKYI